MKKELTKENNTHKIENCNRSISFLTPHQSKFIYNNKKKSNHQAKTHENTEIKLNLQEQKGKRIVVPESVKKEAELKNCRRR
jgi:hypothetical protein